MVDSQSRFTTQRVKQNYLDQLALSSLLLEYKASPIEMCPQVINNFIFSQPKKEGTIFNDRDGNQCTSIDKQQDSDISLQGLSPLINDKENHHNPSLPPSQKADKPNVFNCKNITSSKSIIIQKSKKCAFEKPQEQNGRSSIQKTLKQKMMNGFQKSIQNQKEYIENRLQKYIEEQQHQQHSNNQPNHNHLYQSILQQVTHLHDSQSQQHPTPFNQIPKPFNEMTKSFNEILKPINEIPKPFNQMLEPINPITEYFNEVPKPFKDIPESFHQNSQPFRQIHGSFCQNPQFFKEIPQPFNQKTEYFNENDDNSKEIKAPIKEILQPFNGISNHLDEMNDSFKGIPEQFKEMDEDIPDCQIEMANPRDTYFGKVTAFQVIDDFSYDLKLASPLNQDTNKIILFSNPQKYQQQQQQQEEEFCSKVVSSTKGGQKQIYWEQTEQTQESSGDELNEVKNSQHTLILTSKTKQNHLLNSLNHSPCATKGKIDHTLTQKKDSTLFYSNLNTYHNTQSIQKSFNSQIGKIQTVKPEESNHKKNFYFKISKNNGPLLKKESNFGSQIKLVYDKSQEQKIPPLKANPTLPKQDLKKEILQLGCSSIQTLKFKEQQRKLANFNNLYKMLPKNAN